MDPNFGSAYGVMAIASSNLGQQQDAEKYIKQMEQRGNFVMMDHHKTSLHLQGKRWADVRQDLCGCRMLREYLMGQPYLTLIGKVDTP